MRALGRTRIVLLVAGCSFEGGGVGSADGAEEIGGDTTESGATSTNATSASGQSDAGSTGDTGASASGSDGNSESDGGVKPPPLGPFKPPYRLGVLNTLSNEDNPTLRSDLLEIYFASDRPGIGADDIWRSERASVDDEWMEPGLLPQLNSPSIEGGPELSADGLAMVFDSDRPGGLGSHDLYFATRDDVTSIVWSNPVLVAEVSTMGAEGTPTLSADTLELVFCKPNASADLMRSVRAGAVSPWQIPMAVTELDDDVSLECSPFLTQDGLRIAFATDRVGGPGGRDIWTAVRSPGAPFEAPVVVDGINAETIDEDPWIAPDYSLMVFASDRGGADWNLWVAQAE